MGVLKMSLALFFLVLVIADVYGQNEHAAIGKGKKIVTYLGTDFILRDGCPIPSCDPKNRLCRKLQIDTQTEYKKCLRYCIKK